MEAIEILFTRLCPVADVLVEMIRGASESVDAALYRFSNPKLAQALAQAAERGIRVRLVLDRSKYRDTPLTQEILKTSRLPFRTSGGRRHGKSKLHHKFALFDGASVATGSYNWTLDSENRNFENLAILRDASAAKAYVSEFEELWDSATEPRQDL